MRSSCAGRDVHQHGGRSRQILDGIDWSTCLDRSSDGSGNTTPARPRSAGILRLGIGHPRAWPAAAMTSPIADVPGLSSATIECAACPEKNARGAASAKHGPGQRLDDTNARIPKPAIDTIADGVRKAATESPVSSRSQCRTRGSISRIYAALSTDNVAAVSSTLRFKARGDR